ncbi:NmrA-like family protein [Pseudovibrio sp. Ad37]|nr:NmrA family NAD(P)-binding protein [Pseudovibrio sp. Ad37]KZL16166.1 NmrA-like family protein [Pseudovibrio sp. Ad37]
MYSVQNNWTSSVETEIKQGKALAEAAKKAGVQHFVYSYVGGAERKTGIPHFDSKFERGGSVYLDR